MAYSARSQGKVPSYESRRVANPDRVSTKARLAKQREWRIKHPLNNMLAVARCRAKMRGVLFALTVKDLGDAPERCPVFGFKLKYFGQSSRNGYDTASLDRLDSSLGYVPGNIIIVSVRANQLKGNATPAELRALADFYS